MIFCFFVIVAVVVEFSFMVRNRMLLNIRLLTVYSYNRMLIFDHN